ncbi:MAG: hypothetical protein H0W02_12245 [Ktedonobacteraceae bacterium]|nr:hypothetical protein [Ktedonobacteraceae bacterium]
MHLQQNWEQLLQTCGIEPAAGQQAFSALITAYTSPGRFYHTLDHIQAVLESITSLRTLACDLPALQFAAWFHDSIYDTHAADNEERSADYAKTLLMNFGVSSATIATTKRLIVCTKDHQAATDDSDCHIFLDADLAILGAPATHYLLYSKAIRREYAWVPEEDYRTGRATVLRRFLQRKQIYWTPPMFGTLEERARQNMQAEIDQLT